MRHVLTAMTLILMAPVSAESTPDDMTVHQLLKGIDQAAHSADAHQKMGQYLRRIIRTELAAPKPVICPGDRQRQLDAHGLRAFAVTQAPRKADQKAMRAQPVVIGYLAQEYPCP